MSMLSNSELSVLRREPAHPLVEVAEDDLRPGDAAVVDERGQPRRLVAALEHRGAEVHVVDVQRAAGVDFEIHALARARLARAPREVVLAVVVTRKRLRTTLPNRWLRRRRTDAITQPMPSPAPISSA